ncbi:MAG: hypothetical protein N4A47_07345 [Clostridia bacterium]|jgi:hypothetical protein|nr:hypothetical protein [Clostridia bacterium]
MKKIYKLITLIVVASLIFVVKEIEVQKEKDMLIKQKEREEILERQHDRSSYRRHYSGISLLDFIKYDNETVILHIVKDKEKVSIKDNEVIVEYIQII